MKTLIDLRYILLLKCCILVTVIISACNKNILDEKPLSSLNSDIVLSSPSGFETHLVALHMLAREELTQNNSTYWTNFNGTDMFSSAGREYNTYRNWITWLNPVRAEVNEYWNWAYTKMILQANTIIVYANNPELANIWESEAQRNEIIAEARFFRGYTYNILANLYGGVPIVDTIYSAPKFDFVRETREEVYEFAKKDLEFASQWLPQSVSANKEGRIVKAAADHLLSEVYISLGQYENAIISASNVIESGLYKLMTERFGKFLNDPGDVFSDLFLEGNQNRSAGNLESIYVWQFEANTAGGDGTTEGNRMLANFASFIANIKDPDGIPQLIHDSTGRGVGRSRGSVHYLYDIWKDDWHNDMRNSPFNMRRDFYYNNPQSAYYGQKIKMETLSQEDTLRNLYPYSRKIEGSPWMNNNLSGRTNKDVIVYRLAETYLLRAEAKFKKGDLQGAANDINIVRDRANAKRIQANDVTIDYILDERSRELAVEEPRRRTLIRMGKLVDRVRRYDIIESSRSTIQDYHQFYPIPQTAIDANIGAELMQNSGY